MVISSVSTACPGRIQGRLQKEAFGLHFFVNLLGTGLSPKGRYFDASYGTEYLNAADFEVKAIAGYAVSFRRDLGIMVPPQRSSTGNIGITP